MRICCGNFTRQDVKLLLFDIREFLSKKGILRDIADCIHSTRDRGNALSKIEDHMSNFLAVANNGGTLVVKPIYNTIELISELTSSLTELGFKFNINEFIKQTPTMITYISEFLDGTKIKSKNDAIEECHLEFSKIYGLTFCFNFIQNINGVLKVSQKVVIAMPFFSNISK